MELRDIGCELIERQSRLAGLNGGVCRSNSIFHLPISKIASFNDSNSLIREQYKREERNSTTGPILFYC